MKKLSRAEMKNLMGGFKNDVKYTCTCSGGTGQWFYTGSNQPAQSTINADIANYCASGAATCLWVVQG